MYNLNAGNLKRLNYYYLAVNVPGSTKERSACAELTGKLCNKENRVSATMLKPSASCQYGRHKGSKGQTFTVPELPQLRTSKLSKIRLTPVSKYWKHPLAKEGNFFKFIVCNLFWEESQNLHVWVFDAFKIRLKMYSLPVSNNLPKVNKQACVWRNFH
jgi:hypothetical protein